MVIVGGEIKDRKGVNLPDTLLPVSAMTPKDRSDLDAALNLGVDWVALSFVQRPEDVAELKKVVAGRAAVLAKIEKPKALEGLLRHPRDGRRADGGARRSRRRTATRSRAWSPEADHPRRAQGRKAGRRGDADAGIHDHVFGADPRRSQRRRNRRVRRRRCGDAVGGDRIGRASDRSGAGDGPHRDLGRRRSALSSPFWSRSATRRRKPPAMRSWPRSIR